MRNLLQSSAVIILIMLLVAPITAWSSAFTDPKKDTIIIQFGNNSQIILHIEDKDDLNALSDYDINKMLKDLQLSVADLNDSIKVIQIEDKSGTKYLKDTVVVIHQVEPNNDNSENRTKVKKIRKVPRSHSNFIVDLGLSNYLENDAFPDGNALYAVVPWASWYLAFGPMVRTKILGPLYLDLGTTAALNIYQFENQRTQIEKADDQILLYEDIRNIDTKGSKIATWYWHARAIPMIILPTNRKGNRIINSGLRMGAGPFVGYRAWSQSKFKYAENDEIYKDKTESNFYLKNIRYGLRAQIGFGRIDLFFSYDMNEMFQSDKDAPPIKRFQFGITL